MRIAVAILVGLTCGVSANAQGVTPIEPASPSQPRQPGQAYDEVQQGVEDIGPLGESLEIPMVDLRVPTGFERVYRAPGGGLMRISGAIHAVFPRSQYVATQMGIMPVVPAGAVFYLGAPEAWALDDEGEPVRVRPTGHGGASPLRVGSRVTARVAPALAGGRQEAPDAVDRVTVMSDEPYRQERLETILDAALRQVESPIQDGETPGATEAEESPDAVAPPARGG